MSEKTIQEAIQTVLIATATFDTGDVTINDWGVLDQARVLGPYVVIQTAENMQARFRTQSDENNYSVILNLVVSFTDWDTSLTDFRDKRKIVIDAISAPANATVGLAVRSVRTGGNINPIYETYNTPEQQPDALPAFLTQQLIAECEEF